MVSPAAILMLTSSLSSNLGSLGKCLQRQDSSGLFPQHPFCAPDPPWCWLVSEPQGDSRHLVLLAQDFFELAGGADGEQQSPGQQRVGVQLAGLGVQRGARAVRLGVGAGEQAFKAIHGGLNVLGGEKKHMIRIILPSWFHTSGRLKAVRSYQDVVFRNQGAKAQTCCHLKVERKKKSQL